ncbi:hypothetical protein BC332_06110 [Capsicum chinense]|nr:hypothetical protein BC332_06110 [Capsicum chinense]
MTSPDIADMLEKSKELDRLRKEQEDVLLEINKMHKKLQATPETVEKPGDNSLSKLKMLYTQAKELSESEMSISNQLLSQLDAIAPAGGAGQQRRRKYKLPWSHIIPFPKISDLATTPEFPPGKQVLAVYPGTTALYKATVVNARKVSVSSFLLSQFVWIFFIDPIQNIISIEELIGFRLTFACDGPNGISISRGRPTTTHWSLMMTKKMGLYLNAWSPLTGLSLFQMDITNEI